VDRITNIVIAGLGGQGVIKASDMLSYAAFLAGQDVKKAEVHGMSQRGGSVTSDVRFGKRVLSPMVPPGDADYLVVLDDTQVEPSRHRLREDGVLLQAASIDRGKLPTARALNVAMMGMLSAFLAIPEDVWLDAVFKYLPEKLHDANKQAFSLGRATATEETHHD